MSNDRRDKGREKSESGKDRSINQEQGRGRRSIDYSESPDRNVVFDTIKPPPRPGRSDRNGDSNS
ncbi:hypothetical protein [Pseudomonas nicosulfuronedens]